MRIFRRHRRQALNAAVAIELLHNVFLIRDDVQDEASFVVFARHSSRSMAFPSQ